MGPPALAAMRAPVRVWTFPLHASEGRNFIETVWGRGYVLREPHEEETRIPA